MSNKICVKDLNNKISIERETLVDDNAGGDVSSWAELSEVWAKCEFKSGDEKNDNGNLKTFVERDFTIRFYADLRTADRIIYKDNYYNIRSIDNIDEKNKYMIIKGQRGVSS